MSLSPKLESIFSIIAALGTIQYEFKKRTVLEVLEKLIIVATNPLVWYLIVKVNYTDPLLIIKLIILGIEFKVPRETSFASDNTAKPEGKTRPGQRILKRPKN